MVDLATHARKSWKQTIKKKKTNTSVGLIPYTSARNSTHWNSFSPYLWSVFLELATLLNKFFPRLLTFILPVSQYCCCGIELSLSRKTSKKKKKELSLELSFSQK